MLKKDPLAFIAPVPGGGIFCEGESRCVCTLPLQDPIFGVDYVPGECPALDLLIESHERGHDKETQPCDGRDCITRPKFINPSMGKSSECTLRSRDTQRLAILLNDEKSLGRMTDKCIRQVYAHFNMQRAWVMGQCGFNPLRYPLIP